MRDVSNGHDHIAWRSAAASRVALTAQADRFPFFDAGGDCDVERLPRRQDDAGRPALRNRRQGNRDRDANILTVGRGLTAPARAAGAEQFGEDVRIDRTALTGRAAGAEVEAEIAEVAGTAPRLAAKAKPLELRRARLAFRVDFAAIEGFALLVVAKDLVSRAHFGEPLFRF